MSVPLLKIAIFRKPVIKGKMDVRFPANIETHNFLTIARASGKYTFDIDYTVLTPGPVQDPTAAFIAIFDQAAGVYKFDSLSDLLASTTQIEQHITAPGPVAINPNTGIVRVNQTAGAAITLNLPAAASKTCPVLIADWKGDSGTNNITIVPNGTEKIQGRSNWTIADDNGSIFLRPIPGVGYVK